MKGDFTRDTFKQVRHFSRVLMQQGRVQLDADWNEQAAILLHYLQTLAADIIGPYGGPDTKNLGFELAVNAGNASDFNIAKGRYYVEGVLCENDEEGVTYFNQKEYPQSKRSLPTGTYLAYLDVWEHHVTSLEESLIREVALGGPDTATRAKIVWQLKVISKTPDGKKITDTITPDDVNKLWPSWVSGWQALADCRIKVRLNPETPSDDPCTIAPDSKYRGRENQLYRVEIHKGGALKDAPTFKWSRDNGSIAAAWLGNSQDGGMIVSCARGFSSGQWIEITSESDDLLAQTGQMVKIVRVEGDVLYPESPQTWDETVSQKVRRWDQAETETIHLTDGSEPISEGTTDADWIDLEDGIQIQFQPGGSYRTGDYWMFPARRAGKLEWPGDPKNPDAMAPQGILHCYAPIWIVSAASGGKVTIDPKKDLRRKFAPIP